MPRLGPGEQVADRALGQTEHRLSEQALTDGILAEGVLDSTYKVIRVDLRVTIYLLLHDENVSKHFNDQNQEMPVFAISSSVCSVFGVFFLVRSVAHILQILADVNE